jgi:site-specific recombinase XerD
MPIGEAVPAFLLQKQINGCSARTVQVYRFWLDRLAGSVPDTAALETLALTRFFAALRERGVSTSTVHQAFRTLRTFVRWLVTTRTLRRNPLDEFAMRTPKTFPSVPTDEELTKVLQACAKTTPEGRRNFAMVLALADA